jgi:membrane associated rhomboid family serine protease
MLSDRSYMKADYERERLRALPWLLGVLVVVFIAELVLGSPWFRGARDIFRYLPLDLGALRDGWVWTLLTYGLLNGASPFWVLFLLVGIYMMGRELEPMLGPRRLVLLFIGALLLGGLAWAATNWRFGGTLVGCTSALYGMLVFYACVYPDEPFRLLLFFFLPVTIRPRHLVLVLLVLDVVAFILYELAGGIAPFAHTPSAHLGGMAAGWLCHLLWRGNEQEMGWRHPSSIWLQIRSWLPGRRKASSPSARRMTPEAERVSVAPPASAPLRAEVDRILDKISAQGFASLTPAERRTLDEARDNLARR